MISRVCKNKNIQGVKMKRLEIMAEGAGFDSLTPENGIPSSVDINGGIYKINYVSKRYGPVFYDCPDRIERTITFHGLDPRKDVDAYMIRAMAMGAQMEFDRIEDIGTKTESAQKIVQRDELVA